MMTFNRLFAKQNANTYIHIWLKYVWSLWSLYCDWIKNLTPSGLFVFEAILCWVLNMLNSFAQTVVIAFGWRLTLLYIYIHVVIYRCLHYMIASIIIHIHYWGIFVHAHIELLPPVSTLVITPLRSKALQFVRIFTYTQHPGWPTQPLNHGNGRKGRGVWYCT